MKNQVVGLLKHEKSTKQRFKTNLSMLKKQLVRVEQATKHLAPNKTTFSNNILFIQLMGELLVHNLDIFSTP
jgi:hypothetical protein